MPLIVNGTTIPNGGNVNVGDVCPKKIVVDGTTVWQCAEEPDYIVFDVPGAYAWTTPIGYDVINICATAGGGSGGAGVDSAPIQNASTGGLGGWQGEVYNRVDEPVTPETSIPIVVGAGGEGGSCDGTDHSDNEEYCYGGVGGFSGENTTILTITAVGGKGGHGGWILNAPNTQYWGNGETYQNCGNGQTRNGYGHEFGTDEDNEHEKIVGYGGQASWYSGPDGEAYYGGNGVVANMGNATAESAEVGAGGGGAGVFADCTADPLLVAQAGDGGRGEVRVAWGQPIPKGRKAYVSEMTKAELLKHKVVINSVHPRYMHMFKHPDVLED